MHYEMVILIFKDSEEVYQNTWLICKTQTMIEEFLLTNKINFINEGKQIIMNQNKN